MDKAAKEARNAYKREWARNNPEKVKAAQERYWTRKAEEREQAAKQTAEEVKATTINAGDFAAAEEA